VGGQLLEEAPRHVESAGTAVQGEPVRRVRVLEPEGGREVGGIEQDTVEPTQAAREVGAYALDSDPASSGEGASGGQSAKVPVRGHDAGARHRGGDGEEARPRPDVEEPDPRSDPGERQQQGGVLPGRVDPRRAGRVGAGGALP
jgi:hypothetical protein